MSFIDGLREHFGKYKRNELNVEEDGVFFHRGKTYTKQHILPLRHGRLNIIEQYRTEFYESKHSKFTPHRYFHHLNSSQALCINLFYPLIAENKMGLVLKHLNVAPEVDWVGAFEKESPMEVAKRKTSFDFHLNHSIAGDIYFEVKYSEVEFGKAKKDLEHREKFRATYLPMLKNSPYLKDCCYEEEFFLENYQLLRNFVHISKNARVILLVPLANRPIAIQAQKAYEEILTDEGRAMAKIVYLEDLVKALRANSAGLSDYYEKFQAKYLPGVV